MAGLKRLRDGTDGGKKSDDQPSGDKRIKTSVPSISNYIREALALTAFQRFTVALEPVLRRVVNEEVERGLFQGARTLQRSNSTIRQIQAPAAETTTLQLIFSKPLSLPIFTGSKLEDNEGNPLQVLLVDTRRRSPYPVSSPPALPTSVRVEIVVLDGDFPGKRETWTSAEFEKSMVKERTGRRPLITGDVLLTLRSDRCSIGDLTFTDNSSWIRSRHFRLGARVAPGSCPGLKIKETMTDPFMVRDHRGELYKKHYPPSLQDEVWRLEKIGKEGVFHRKLKEKSIHTVQDFLKLWVVDQARLREILGDGMSDRMWEVLLKHAKTCEMGSKQYLYRNSQFVLLLNPICQVQGVLMNGQIYPLQNLQENQRDFFQTLVREAYDHSHQLEEVDQEVTARAPLLAQGKALPAISAQPSSPFSATIYHVGAIQDHVPFRNAWRIGDTNALQEDVEFEFSFPQEPDGSMHPSNNTSDSTSEDDVELDFNMEHMLSGPGF